MSLHSQQPLTQGTPHDVTIKPSINTLAQGSMFWQPDYRRASPWLEHTPFLFWLVEAIHPRLSVGLGLDAVSHLAICQATTRLRLDAHNYLVTGDKDAAATEEAARELAAEEYATTSHWLETTPTRAIQQFDEGSIDLLVLNISADDDSVDYLIDRWLSRLSSQGVVLLPGIARREPGCHVFRIFEKLKAQYPYFVFHHGEGLGLLAIGQKLPPLLENLINAVESPASSRVVQDIFARLGRSCRDKLTAQEQRSLVQQLEARVTAHQTQWQEAEAQQASLNEQLSKADQDSKELKGRISSQEERFAHERGRLAERVSSLEESNSELKNELMRLRHQGEQREKEAYSALEDQKQSNQQLSRSLQASKNQAEQHRAQVEEKDEALKILQEKLDIAEQELQEQARTLNEFRQDSATRSDELAKLTRIIESKNDELDQTNTELERVQAEWQKSLDDIHQYQQELQTRFEELAKLTALLESSEQSVEWEQGEAAREIEQLKRDLAQQRQEAKVFADERFRELAILTELLEKKDAGFEGNQDYAVASYEELPALEAGNIQAASTSAIKKEVPLTKRAIKRQVALIESSRYFDAQWYLAQYPDIARDAKMSADPARHYLLMGGFEGRNPGPDFDSAYYLTTHVDVAQSNINPLIHFLKFGEKEQRSIKG